MAIFTLAEKMMTKAQALEQARREHPFASHKQIAGYARQLQAKKPVASIKALSLAARDAA